MKLRKSLGTLSLVFILYFCTSGGAFTTETLVHEVGPGLALLILLVVPIAYSVPEILVVGELASMLPEEGGYYRWVDRAFGRFWAFQNGWLTWMYSLVDMAIYPILFIQYLGWFFPALTPAARWLVQLGVIWGATALNLSGALRVGRWSVMSGFFVLAGFAALAVFSVPHMTHAPWHPFATATQSPLKGMAVGVSIALWNYFGWDNASPALGEVKDATRTYPRALAFALPLVALGYFIPLLPTLGASDWTQWRDGGWPQIALASAGSAGRFIAPWLAIAGMVSALSLFSALLLSFSRVPFVMAEDGLLPRMLGRVDARGTPRNAVIVASVFYSAFVLLPFGSLVVADTLLYSLALGLEAASLVALRTREPELRGAFRIPLGRNGVAVLAAMPLVIMAFVVAMSFQDGEYGIPALVGAAIAIALGPLAYRFASRPRHA